MTDQPYIEHDDNVPLCDKHGVELERDGWCEMCDLEHYERYDPDDREDDVFERERDRDWEAAA